MVLLIFIIEKKKTDILQKVTEIFDTKLEKLLFQLILNQTLRNCLSNKSYNFVDIHSKIPLGTATLISLICLMLNST